MPAASAHRVIVEAAIAELGAELPKELLSGLLEGIVDPDAVPDREAKLRITSRGRVSTRLGYAKHHSTSRVLVDYYFNLSLYNLRRGNEHGAGFMLGRALHYVQDGALSRRRYLVLDVHDEEEKAVNMLAKSAQRVEEVCKAVDVSSRRASSRAEEALCIALRETASLLKRFIEESTRPVNVAELKRRVTKIRLVKALLVLALAFFAYTLPQLIAVSLLATPAIIFYRPKTYYEAMRAGLMVLKPYGTKPAYEK
ncbi:MAG: hypothetical protein QXZ31_03715 [Thermofilaceae archaeon]